MERLRESFLGPAPGQDRTDGLQTTAQIIICFPSPADVPANVPATQCMGPW